MQIKYQYDQGDDTYWEENTDDIDAMKDYVYQYIAGVFGIEDKEELSTEELSVLAKDKVESLLASNNAAKEAPKGPTGKSDKPFKSANSSVFLYSSRACL